jgi:hypothetical protein
MSDRIARTICTSISALALCAAANGDPLTKTITYQLHETPSDPNSPVTFNFKFDLKEAEAEGNTIGWHAVSIELRQPDPNGAADTVWLDENPTRDTTDELWWITHADLENLTDDEFTIPPAFTGTATAADPSDADMDYEFEGTESQASVPYENTAYIDYLIVPVGGPTPVKEGEQEPVELPPTQYPPLGN